MQQASTSFEVLNSSGRHAAVLSLHCHTGRKHQIRLHCADQLGTPILGDPRHGNVLSPYLWGVLGRTGVAPRLHLHARSIMIPGMGPRGGPLHVTAPLPMHMRDTLKALQMEVPALTDARTQRRTRWNRPHLTHFTPSKRSK